MYRTEAVSQEAPTKILHWKDGIICPACGYERSSRCNVTYVVRSARLPERISKLCDQCGYFWFEETKLASNKRIRYTALAAASIFLAFVVFSCILLGLAVS